MIFVDVEIPWLKQFEEKPEPAEPTNMDLTDYLTMLEENEYK